MGSHRQMTTSRTRDLRRRASGFDHAAAQARGLGPRPQTEPGTAVVRYETDSRRDARFRSVAHLRRACREGD